MKKQGLFISILIVVLLAGFFVEIINPHSFLGTTGAYIRGILLLVGVIVWWNFLENFKIRLIGLILLVIMSFLYFYYGTTSFCQSTYYEKYIKNNISHQYSCVEIIKETIIK